MATEGDAYGASLKGTHARLCSFRFAVVFEQALDGHWAQGKNSGQRAFCEIFAQQNGVFQASSGQSYRVFSHNLLSNFSRAVHELLF